MQKYLKDMVEQLAQKVKIVEYAIENNVYPQRIYEGSSGSYFAKNSEFVS